jgi:hypothetical protein
LSSLSFCRHPLLQFFHPVYDDNYFAQGSRCGRRALRCGGLYCQQPFAVVANVPRRTSTIASYKSSSKKYSSFSRFKGRLSFHRDRHDGIFGVVEQFMAIQRPAREFCAAIRDLSFAFAHLGKRTHINLTARTQWKDRLYISHQAKYLDLSQGTFLLTAAFWRDLLSLKQLQCRILYRHYQIPQKDCCCLVFYKLYVRWEDIWLLRQRTIP